MTLTVEAAATRSNGAQQAWAALDVRARLAVIRRLRHALASRSREFASRIARDPAETLASEVLPLAEACRFLEKQAPGLLAAKRVNAEGRPVWLTGVSLEIRREALGTVLVIGPFNYPLFLPGVQAVQALAAGNAVIVKPGRGGRPVLDLMAECLAAAGLDMHLFQVLGEDPAEAEAVIETGVHKVFLTGSNATGMAVLARLARTGTPSVMELSGDDPVFVRHGADLDLVLRALRFGVSFNDGNTCIAPKRVYAPADIAARLERDSPLPVIAASDDEALRLAGESGYALGATVFGPEAEATEFARRLDAGVVVINDMIVPTADPRIAFGGRGRSGFGLTRGPEGLLEMTVLKTIVVRRSRWLPHFDPRHPADTDLFAGFLGWLHGGSAAQRWRGLKVMIGAAMRRRKG